MEYFTLLDLNKEPFSNSPDPEMFFQSTQHQSCLQKLELAIRLKRGLSVVIGDIGTGKSTLCRQLLRLINSPKDKIKAHLFLDPEFTSPLEFLATISKSFGIEVNQQENSEWQLKDSIKNYLFEQAVEKKNIPVLILDEGQKLPGFCIEILREFLNFETNKHKLLQIVIFAQKEFDQMLSEKANFADRITTFHHLNPLSFSDTRKMIKYRLAQAHNNSEKAPKLFTPLATLMIYIITRGYPRKIVMLCSKLIIAMLVKNKKRSGAVQVFASALETSMFSRSLAIRTFAYGTIAAVATVAVLSGITAYSTFKSSKQLLVIKEQNQEIKKHIAAIKPAALKPTKLEATEVLSEVIKQQKISSEKTHQTDTENQFRRIPSPFSAQSQNEIPEDLGTLKFDSQATLSKMIARIYGRYNNLRLKKVLKKNPHIKNPDQVTKNTLITFPKEKNQRFTPSEGKFWVELSQTSTLEEAYNIVKNIPESSPPVLIIPAINKSTELVFVIVVDDTFSDQQSAADKLENFTLELRKNSVIRQVYISTSYFSPPKKNFLSP